MSSIITHDNIREFAYTNEHLIKGKPVGIMTFFHGLSKALMLTEDPPEGVFLAERGIIEIYPYSAPWGWANGGAIKYIDECLDALFDFYGELPLAISGGSMGGYTSLIYTCTTKRKIVCCSANCPVCDLEKFYNSSHIFHRSLYCANIDEPDFFGALRKKSPVNKIAEFPRVPYFINQGSRDTAVFKQENADVFVAKMREAGHDVTYDETNATHCHFEPDEFERYYTFTVEHILKNK